MGRVARWLGWTVLLSLVPYAAILGMRIVDTGSWPGLGPLVGAGQLLLTCVALLGGGLKELSGTSSTPSEWSRDVMTLLNVVFVIMLSMWYGFVGNRAITGQGLDSRSENFVVLGSLASLVACVTIGAVSISVSGAREAS